MRRSWQSTCWTGSGYGRRASGTDSDPALRTEGTESGAATAGYVHFAPSPQGGLATHCGAAPKPRVHRLQHG